MLCALFFRGISGLCAAPRLLARWLHNQGFLVKGILQIEQKPNLRRRSARQEGGKKPGEPRDLSVALRGEWHVPSLLGTNGFGLETRRAQVGRDKETDR